MTTCQEAILAFFKEFRGVASEEQVSDHIEKAYSGRWKRSTVGAHLYGCSVNNPAAYRHHSSFSKFLFDHGNRKYELYDPAKHGKWEGGYAEGQRGFSPREDIEIEIAEPSIGLERDLEEHLSRHVEQLEKGLRVETFEGRQGRQFNTTVGRIDLLGLDGKDNLVVIELKADVATDRTVGQILRYMGWVKERLAEARQVRGIIVADDFDDGARFAVKAMNIPVDLIRFSVEFKFQKLTES